MTFSFSIGEKKGVIMNFLQTFKILNRTISIKLTTEKVFSFSFLFVRTPDKASVGMTSRTKDGKHVIFLDYDGLTKTEVFDELNYLQAYFELGNFYIFQNDMKDSFHAICFDKFALYDAIEIISQTSADKGFKKAPLYFRKKRWVLRCGTKGDRKKPVYVDVLRSRFDGKSQSSSAHRVFLNTHYNLRIPRKNLEDGFDEQIGICKYNTASKC